MIETGFACELCKYSTNGSRQTCLENFSFRILLSCHADLKSAMGSRLALNPSATRQSLGMLFYPILILLFMDNALLFQDFPLGLKTLFPKC